jgi:hypothetical protein
MSSRSPWSAEELVAALALLHADHDLARGERQLGRVLESLPASPRDQDQEDLDAEAMPDTTTLLRVAARCALENLLPARRALWEIREELGRLPGRSSLDREPPAPSSSHAAFRELLAGIRPTHLAGLRHLLTCPLCQALARCLLVDLPPQTSPTPAAPAG